jgi:hypothetical protein
MIGAANRRRLRTIVICVALSPFHFRIPSEWVGARSS